MLTTGEFIDTGRAIDLGLINRAVPIDGLDAAVDALADKIASKLSAAVRIGKEAFYNQIEMPISAAYAYTGDVMVKNMLLRDTDEGIQAFLEKRPPDWSE
jgi:enoyl-CoA hydratase/carnithine racemase